MNTQSISNEIQKQIKVALNEPLKDDEIILLQMIQRKSDNYNTIIEKSRIKNEQHK